MCVLELINSSPDLTILMKSRFTACSWRAQYPIRLGRRRVSLIELMDADYAAFGGTDEPDIECRRWWHEWRPRLIGTIVAGSLCVVYGGNARPPKPQPSHMLTEDFLLLAQDGKGQWAPSSRWCSRSWQQHSWSRSARPRLGCRAMVLSAFQRSTLSAGDGALSGTRARCDRQSFRSALQSRRRQRRRLHPRPRRLRYPHNHQRRRLLPVHLPHHHQHLQRRLHRA